VWCTSPYPTSSLTWQRSVPSHSGPNTRRCALACCCEHVHLSRVTDWEKHKLIEDQLSFLLTEVVAVRSAQLGAIVVEKILGIHQKREADSFSMFYIKATQLQYTSWIMMAVPIALYASASLLVEFNQFNTGEIIAILNSFLGARSNLLALVSMKEEWKVAVDLVADLSNCLCYATKEAMPRVAAAQRVMDLLAKQAPHAPPGLHRNLSLHDVSFSSDAAEKLLAGNTCLRNVSGFIPLGGLYGFSQDLPDTHHRSEARSPQAPRNDVAPARQLRIARMDMIMDLLGKMRVPNRGVVLVPPHVRVQVLPRENGIIECECVMDIHAAALAVLTAC
jgi:hypothetical protein